MPKYIYIIFILSFTQLIAMQTIELASEYKRAVSSRVIAVANVLQQGVIAEIYKSNTGSQAKELEKKAWIRSVSTGRIEVSPPHSPSITHVLVVRDSHDAEVLAQTCFMHPKQDTMFAVLQETDGILVREVTHEDHPSYRKPSIGSGKSSTAKKKHVHWQDE